MKRRTIQVDLDEHDYVLQWSATMYDATGSRYRICVHPINPPGSWSIDRAVEAALEVTAEDTLPVPADWESWLDPHDRF